MMSLYYLEKDRSLDGWSSFGEGSIVLTTDKPLSNALPAQMRYSLVTSSTSVSGFRNGGFYGMNIQVQNYTANFFYRPLAGAHLTGGKLNIGFRDATDQTIYGTSTVNVSTATVGDWTNVSSTISVLSAAPSTKNFFFIEFPVGSKGEFEFNLISCFPPTYKNRPNGARIDLAQAFANLKPGFVRLPGGNDLEGLSIPERFIWNNTIGPLENRPGRRGTWVGYNTEGFGLLELLTFTEDIDAIPILGVYAGYSLDGSAVPPDQLQPYVDEVIKELDFLTASADDNEMGALRKSMGRAKPFDIKYVEIGNEDFFAWTTYGYRWSAFYNPLSQRYPNITFIATTSRYIENPPAVDDHDYQVPLFYIDNFRLYEYAPRPDPKVLVGEFAARIARLSPPYPSVKTAIAESVFRIGFERNSDIMIGGCYAPVLQNVNNTQGGPNLIVFDADIVVKTTSYLAQKMFGDNLGDIVLNSTAVNSSMTHQSIRKGEEGDGKLGNLYFVATKHTNNNTLIVKLASVDTNDTVINAQVQGSTTSSTGVAYILTAGPGVDPATVHNTIDNPNAVSIATMPVRTTSGSFSITVPSWSVVVVTLSL
jgi:alpha-N-arabinofuranosidase